MGFLKLSLLVVCSLVAYSYIQRFLEQDLPVVLNGYYHPAFKAVADKFRENLKSGKERGASFAVFHKGECVFDMWGGYADVESRRPWREDTMTMAFSLSKGIVAIVIATMVDKGHLDYNRPVVDYWPAFGQKNKGNITVGMLLSHQAGLVALDEPIKVRDILDDPEKVEKILAAQGTCWPAGTQFGYHSLTFGLYADVLVQKADPRGRNVVQVFQEELAIPYGLDIFMNTPKELFHRSARMYVSPPWATMLQILMTPRYIPRYIPTIGYVILFPESLMARSTRSVREFAKMEDMTLLFNDPHLKEAHMSAVLASGTARGIAKLYDILANGGAYKGKQLLSKDGLERLSTPLVSGTDFVLRSTVSFGPGTAVQNNSKGQPTFGHTGHGGQVGRADPNNHLGYAYLTNFISIFGFGDDPRYLDLEETMFTCLEEYTAAKEKTGH